MGALLAGSGDARLQDAGGEDDEGGAVAVGGRDLRRSYLRSASFCSASAGRDIIKNIYNM